MSPIRRVRIDDGRSQASDESDRLEEGEAVLSLEEYEVRQRQRIDDSDEDQVFTDVDFEGKSGWNECDEDDFIQTPEQAYGLEPDYE